MFVGLLLINVWKIIINIVSVELIYEKVLMYEVIFNGVFEKLIILLIE